MNEIEQTTTDESDSGELESPFNFEEHEQKSIRQYLEQQEFYTNLAEVVRRILEASLADKTIKVHSVVGRAKHPTSFGKKAAKHSEDNPSKPRYPNPFTEITDIAAVRVISYLPSTLVEIDKVLSAQFDIVEKLDKGAKLIAEERFGYQSVHYLVKLKEDRCVLPEYMRFSEAVTEVQVRTILQHAWAEFEHDIQYKATETTIPSEIKRRFMALAGLLEIADREFESIQEEDETLKQKTRKNVQEGNLGNVEISSDSVKTFLNQKLGEDGRIRDFNYIWIAGILKKLGFKTLEQVQECIAPFDDEKLSRIATNGKRGQITRFELLLLAGLGQTYLEKHPRAKEPEFQEEFGNYLSRFKEGEIETGSYNLTERVESTESDFE